MPIPANKFQCTYCGKVYPIAQRTEDHVVAESWFPSSTPSNIGKWKVPACTQCNHRLGRAEEHCLVRFGLCLDVSDPACTGIVEKARSAIEPKRGKNPKDSARRANLRRRILSEVMPIRDLTQEGLIPGFIDNFLLGSRLGVRLSAKDLDMVANKWARGIHFLRTGRIVGEKGSIEPMMVHDLFIEAAFQPLSGFLQTDELGPGVSVTYVSAHDENTSASLYKFALWQRFKVMISVEEPGVWD